MRRKRLNNLLIKILIVLVLCGLAGSYVFTHLYSFLAVTHRLDAGVLVVEGWIPTGNLQRALDEFRQHGYTQMVITSIRLPNAYEMHSKGGLVVGLTENGPIPPQKVSNVSIAAYGTEVDGVYAHFSLIVNDTLMGKAMTGPMLKTYSFDLHTFPDSVYRLVIKYDNDLYKEGQDRNLYVESLEIDGRHIPARSPMIRYDRGKIDGKNVRRTDLFSEAEVARGWLLAHGLADSLVVALNAPEVDYNKTYTSALAVRQWMAAQGKTVPFNLFSVGAHARRSRMLFAKAFDGKVRVGIIASPRRGYSEDNWWKVKAGRQFVMDQVLKYLYAKFIFYPALELQKLKARFAEGQDVLSE